MTTKLSFSRALVFLAVFLLVGVVSPIQADGVPPGSPGTLFGFGFSFDENGKGVFSILGGANTPLQGVLSPDPSGSGIPMALTYFLPGTVSNGDVLVSNPDEGLGDVIRFTDAAGNLTGTTADRMIYYSDITPKDIGDSLADTPAPPINLGSGASASAIEGGGTEADNNFLYLPAGIIPIGVNDNAYFGVSDGPASQVPEPSSLILLGSGLLFLWRFRHSIAA